MNITTGQAERSIDHAEQCAMLVLDRNRFMFAEASTVALLADSARGLKDERRAAHAAINEIATYMHSPAAGSDLPMVLMRAMQSANARICQFAALWQMTLDVSVTAVVVHRDGLEWIAAGDNGLFCLRQGKLHGVRLFGNDAWRPKL